MFSDVALRDAARESGYNFLASAGAAFLFVGVLSMFWPQVIPFGFFQFWENKGSIWDAILGSWPLFLWGISVSSLSFFVFNRYKEEPHEIFLIGLAISLWAGFIEEICFRWLIFFSAIIMASVVDWLLLGFMGLHVIQWFYMSVLCPVANFFTLGMLAPYLQGNYGWAVAAAIISSNGRFRNGHAYLGPVGFINAWFCGMYFFVLMFQYGLLAGIIVHFLYDLFLFSVRAIDATLEKRVRTL